MCLPPDHIPRSQTTLSYWKTYLYGNSHVWPRKTLREFPAQGRRAAWRWKVGGHPIGRMGRFAGLEYCATTGRSSSIPFCSVAGRLENHESGTTAAFPDGNSLAQGADGQSADRIQI